MWRVTLRPGKLTIYSRLGAPTKRRIVTVVDGL